MTLPLLPGLDGVKKMSKSLNNYIGIDESPKEIFGKIMSLSDETMWVYFELVSFRPLDEIKRWQKEVEEGLNPRDVKFRLAEEIVERFHGVTAAKHALDEFIAQFQKGAIPDDLPEFFLATSVQGLQIGSIIKQSGLTESTSEAVRMIQQGAVKIDGERIHDRSLILHVGQTVILQVGKRRFAKVSLIAE